MGHVVMNPIAGEKCGSISLSDRGHLSCLPLPVAFLADYVKVFPWWEPLFLLASTWLVKDALHVRGRLLGIVIQRCFFIYY
jgi:hypothetical protein